MLSTSPRFLQWQGQHFFVGPTFVISGFDGAAVHAKSPRPLSGTESLAIQRQADVVAFVLALFAACRPSTVRGRVRAVIVDALKRVVATRRVAHILIERFKRVSPTLADVNSATAVPLVTPIRRVVATLSHCHPCDVRLSVSLAVRRKPLSAYVAMIATATLCVLAVQVCSLRNNLFAAIASAFPERSAGCQGRFKAIKRDHHKAVVSLASNVRNVRRQIRVTASGHWRNPLRTGLLNYSTDAVQTPYENEGRR